MDRRGNFGHGYFYPMKNILFAAVLFLTGCATGSHIITGTARPAIAADAVKIYSDAPAKFEKIGIVRSSFGGQNQHATDKALAELKIQAGSIGANGILLGDPLTTHAPVNVAPGFVIQGQGTALTGTAIFVP